MTNLRETVALMRELGVTTYKYATQAESFEIVLGRAGSVVPSEDVAPSGEAEPEAEVATPEAFKRLPVAYRNPALYGGRLPNLDG